MTAAGGVAKSDKRRLTRLLASIHSGLASSLEVALLLEVMCRGTQATVQWHCARTCGLHGRRKKEGVGVGGGGRCD